MGLLDKVKSAVADQIKHKPPQPVQGEVFFTQSFTQSKSFRGHKRFRLTTNGYEPTEQGFADFISSGRPIGDDTTIILSGRRFENFVFLDVAVDGYLIGNVPIWTLDEAQEEFLNKQFYSGHVTSAHIRIEERSTYLFLKAE